MLNKLLDKISGVDVYFEKRKIREYVGRLRFVDKKFIFIYDDVYLYKERSISLGPDLPLTAKKFTAKVLFPSFADRIPSVENPAYNEYCKMVGIDPNEKNPLILLSTLGRKGPSSFIFIPYYENIITKEDVINFRSSLNLTIREFSKIFDFSFASINRIETGLASGKDVLKRLEIYISFPKVALYELQKNGPKIKDEKRKFAEIQLKAKMKELKTHKIDK
jgi:HipA-like protein